MTIQAGELGYWCVRCGEPFDESHVAHPEDQGHPVLSRLFELPRRMDLFRGEYQRPCPTCRAGPASWCQEHGESLFEMHEARR